jgi:hypothetical protein
MSIFSPQSIGWIGFLHCIRSLIIATVTGIIIFLLILMEVDFLASLFGFFFATTAQTVFFEVFILAVGTILSLTLSRNSSDTRDNRRAVARVSSFWLFGFLSIIFLFLFFGDQTPHYGVTAREESYVHACTSIILLLEFYFITRFTFIKRP